MQKPASIAAWPETDRPREKLLLRGESALADSELLAIILRMGTRGKSAVDIGREILQKFGTFRGMARADVVEWRKIKGLGAAKIAQIRAALEIGRRAGEAAAKDKRAVIRTSHDVAAILMPGLRDLKKECVKIVLLDVRNRIIDIVGIEEGTVDRSQPIIREVFQPALLRGASFIICAHNHPSGDPAPSRDDRTFTQALFTAGEALGIMVLDHIIIGDRKYYSFADKGSSCL